MEYEDWLPSDRGDTTPWMQFTELLDRDGKEIWEGDVLCIPDVYTETVDVGIGSVPVAQTPENHLAEVIFEDGCFKVNIRERGEMFWKAHYNFELLKEEVDWKKITVVGNVWENPELIEKKV